MKNMVEVSIWFSESDVYEDPRVLYELIRQDEEPVTLENYLVSYLRKIPCKLCSLTSYRYNVKLHS